MKQRQDEEKKRQVWHKEKRHVHRNKKVRLIPSSEKLMMHDSIQTFFSTLKFSFCYLYFVKKKNKKTGTQNGIIKCIFFTPNYLRTLKKRADPSRSFKLNATQQLAQPGSSGAFKRVLAGITFHFQSTGTKILGHCQVLPHCLSKEKIQRRKGTRSCAQRPAWYFACN